MATAAVKEEPETAPYSLSLLLTDRNTNNPQRCRAMTASSLGGHPPPPAPLNNAQNVIPQTPQSCLTPQNIINSQQPNNNHQQSAVVNQQSNSNSSNPPPSGLHASSQVIPQSQMNGMPAAFDRVPAHSPSNMTSEAAKRNSSPNKPPANRKLGLDNPLLQQPTKRQFIGSTAKDPLSHRIIEKRRRDRMNNCLADLSRLIPTYYLKKGRGRIEKTEIIEMAIKYMKHLQAHACNQIENCDVTTKQEHAGNRLEQYHLGYQECVSESMQFLVESEGFFSGDSLCVRLMNHLTKHCEKILNNEGYVARQSGASSSTSSGYHANSSSTGSSSDGNEESAYRSDDRPGSDERDDKSGSSAMDSSSGMGSQLREILQQHSGSGGGMERRSGYSSGLSSNNSSSGDDSIRMYKFKSNMKHRFSADLEQSHQVRKKRRDSESSCGNYTDCEKDRVTPNGLLSRPTSYQDGFPNDSVKMLDGQDSPMLEKNSGTPSPQPKYEHPGGRTSPTRLVSEGSGGTIPIFALNQNGNYYVPLTVEQSVLAPAMAGLSDSSPVLHPVSIYVNFCSTVPGNVGAIHPPHFGGVQAPPSNVYPGVGLRPAFGNHNSSLHHFESSGHNGRFPSRMYNERKRRDTPRQGGGLSQFEEQRTNISNPSDIVEKREPGEIDMREFRESRDHHHQQLPRDPASHDHGRELRDQDHIHEVREVRNLRTIRDLRESREVREIRDPVQTVREFIDANNTCPNNTGYSRTHPHWAQAYHIQSKN